MNKRLRMDGDESYESEEGGLEQVQRVRQEKFIDIKCLMKRVKKT